MIKFTRNCDFGSLIASAVFLLLCVAGLIYGIVIKSPYEICKCLIFGCVGYALVHILIKEGTRKEDDND